LYKNKKQHMKKIAFLICATASLHIAIAQKGALPKDWHLKDAASGFNGISLDKAYDFLKQKKRASKTVVVAVIDSGIDTLHEDLKPVLWKNPGEIPYNGIDDDKNGYVDDVHGWNFLGGKDGRSVKEDSYEAVRVYHKFKAKWDGKPEPADAASKKEYAEFKRAEKKVFGEDEGGPGLTMMKGIQKNMTEADNLLKKVLGKETYSGNDAKAYETKTDEEKKAKGMIVNVMQNMGGLEATNTEIMTGLSEYVASLEKKEAAKTNVPEEYRKNIVGDDETNLNDRNYGNNDIMASTPFHGTHCSGIIAAARKNGKGVDGVADNVRIMALRAVPDGDEHDKDIANAIRYAVDNGAKIISMSFGKDFSPEKKWVDDAFKYAASKNVLLVHAAGNDAKNVDTAYNFPNPIFEDGSGKAANVITVGASGDKKNGGYTASFSNYGKKEVDVFAPGVDIHSTIPGGTTYGNASGTSMACPVVSGIAALIMQHYPTLTALQVKEAIEKSVSVPTEKVTNPETGKKVALSELSKTGGFVNAYGAIRYADNLVTKKMAMPTPPPTKIKKGTKQ
jgi:subtilisin family serine protease